MKILVLEDEESIASFITEVLEREGNIVTACDSVEEAYKHGYEMTHDLVILDLMLAGKRGEHFIKEIKKKRLNIPVLVLSALNRISDKIELFSLGADDYMTKPFDSKELVARVNVLYRLYLQIQTHDEIRHGTFQYFRKQNRVVRDGRESWLTKKEGELLEFLLENKGRTVRSEEIIRRLWGSKITYHSNVLQTCVRRLRKKIDAGHNTNLIRNHHGIGYSLIIPE